MNNDTEYMWSQIELHIMSKSGIFILKNNWNIKMYHALWDLRDPHFVHSLYLHGISWEGERNWKNIFRLFIISRLNIEFYKSKL